MEYLRRLGLIGTITIVHAITARSLATRQMNLLVATQLQPLAAELLRIRPQGIAVAVTGNLPTAAERVPTSQARSRELH